MKPICFRGALVEIGNKLLSRLVRFSLLHTYLKIKYFPKTNMKHYK